MVLFILQHIKILFIEQSSIVWLVIDQLAATYAPSNAFDPFSLSFRQKIYTSQYLSLYNKQYYLRKLNAYGSKINICQAASWSFNMQLIVYRGFSSAAFIIDIFVQKRGINYRPCTSLIWRMESLNKKNILCCLTTCMLFKNTF